MLRYLWEKWINFGELLAGIFGGMLLTIFYYTIFSIPGIILSYRYEKAGKCDNKGSYFYKDVSALCIKEINEAKEM